MDAKNFQLPMDVIQIQRCIPHRPPFLLVDRILELEPEKRIVGIRTISVSDPILAGHFPGRPIVPGVMIVEGLAQIAGVLGYLASENGVENCLLTEISNSRFRRPVVPGDVLRYDVKVVKRRSHFFWFEGTASVDNEVAVEASLSAFLK